METDFGPIARNTLSEEIIKQIIAQIHSGKLKPGSKLPSERELMELFQVSRSSIREALHSLTMIGLLETYPSAGTFVNKQMTDVIASRLEWALLLNNHELMELMEVREPLEIQAAALAAERATPEDIETFRDAVRAYQASLSTGENLMSSEENVHRTIAQMSGNPTLLRLIVTFQGLLKDYRETKKIGFSTDDASDQDYLDMLEAMVQGDAEVARLIMTRHLQKSKRFALVAQLGEQTELHAVTADKS